MSDALIKKLNKTRASINAHISRGLGMGTGERPNHRGCELRSRYDAISDEFKNADWKGWVAYCNSIGSDPSHSGFDLFA